MDRVQRVFLATGSGVDAEFMAAEHRDLLIALAGDEPDAQALLAKFPVYDGVAPTTAGRLYLIDPLGNLVLSYSAAAPDKALLTDVKKLLRLSHIG
jgi:20S proteasome alpha/beta subunit